MSMPSPTTRAALTPRDLHILAALEMCPFTAAQLRDLSETFPSPFPSEHRLRQRLRRLAGCGLIASFPYATTGPGALRYSLLTREGFRLLHGPSEPLPPRSVFRPVSRSLEPHTQLLAEVLRHLLHCAHRDSVRVSNFHRENLLRLEIDGTLLLPDSAFDLVTPAGRTFSFYLEVDTGSEPYCSRTERNTLQRKVREYEAWADRSPGRFRVLFITRGAVARVQHFLALAREGASNPDRSLFYGITVGGFLDIPSLRARHLLNHRGEPVALVEERAEQPARRQIEQPVLAAA